MHVGTAPGMPDNTSMPNALPQRFLFLLLLAGALLLSSYIESGLVQRFQAGLT